MRTIQVGLVLLVGAAVMALSLFGRESAPSAPSAPRVQSAPVVFAAIETATPPMVLVDLHMQATLQAAAATGTMVGEQKVVATAAAQMTQAAWTATAVNNEIRGTELAQVITGTMSALAAQIKADSATQSAVEARAAATQQATQTLAALAIVARHQQDLREAEVAGAWFQAASVLLIALMVCVALYAVVVWVRAYIDARSRHKRQMEAIDEAKKRLWLQDKKLYYLPPGQAAPIQVDMRTVDGNKLALQNAEAAAGWKSAILRFFQFGEMIGGLSQNQMRDAEVMEVEAWKTLVAYLRDDAGVVVNRRGSRTEYAPGWDLKKVREAMRDGDFPPFPVDENGRIVAPPEVQSPVLRPAESVPGRRCQDIA